MRTFRIAILSALMISVTLEVPSFQDKGGTLSSFLRDINRKSIEAADSSPVSIELPYQIGQTPYLVFRIFSEDPLLGGNYQVGYPYSSGGGPRGKTLSDDYHWEKNVFGTGNTINLLFSHQEGHDTHLLLQKKGLIVAADFPDTYDTLQRFIIYRMVFEDTNQDSTLNVRDRARLYVSELDGTNLRPVTPDSLEVLHYFKVMSTERLILQVRIPRIPPPNQNRHFSNRPYRLLWYDIQSDSLYRFQPQDEFLLEAAEYFYPDSSTKNH